MYCSRLLQECSNATFLSQGGSLGYRHTPAIAYVSPFSISVWRVERLTFLEAEVYRPVESAALLTGSQRECAGYAPRQPRSSERQVESAMAQT